MTDNTGHEKPEAAISQQSAYTRKNHPDLHAINDWAMYGPNNCEIERLVCVLTLDQGKRLADVEDAIVTALQEMLDGSPGR